jgi:predicted RNA-binding protein Jag
VTETLSTQIATFVQSVIDAMGVGLTATIEETSEATRINLEGEDGGALIRRGGEGLQALQAAGRRQPHRDRLQRFPP